MPHKDPEIRKAYLREWNRRNKGYQIGRFAKRLEKDPESLRQYNRENMRRWRANNPDKVALQSKNRKRNDKDKCSYLQNKYDMTLEQWKSLFILQGSCCAICKSYWPNGANWHTDHCHKTGKVRGILCNGCNTGLGQFKDKITSLQSAISYLERYQ